MMIQYFNDPAISGAVTIKSQVFIQSASYTGSNQNGGGTGNVAGYDAWSEPRQVTGTNVNHHVKLISSVSPGNTRGIAQTLNLNGVATGNNSVIADYQGKYVRIYQTAYTTTAFTGHANSILKIKGFVYRTSRSVGGATSPPSNILK
jgi:hypothetical protein